MSSDSDDFDTVVPAFLRPAGLAATAVEDMPVPADSSSSSRPIATPSPHAWTTSLSIADVQGALSALDGLYRSLGRTYAVIEDRPIESADFARASLTLETARAYRADLRGFAAWYEQHVLAGATPLPLVAAISAYLTWRANEGGSSASIARCLSGLRYGFSLLGVSIDPGGRILTPLVKGIQRVKARPPVRKKAIWTDDLALMVGRLPADLSGLRDRLLLLVGFSGAFRRSELVQLLIEDIEDIPGKGMILELRRSKTDQTGKGIRKGIPELGTALCAVRAVRSWLRVTGLSEGPLLRSILPGKCLGGSLSDRQAANIVKRAAAAAGLDPALYSGHSLRRGFLNAAAAAHASPQSLQRQAGHSSFSTTAAYIDEASILADSAVHALSTSSRSAARILELEAELEQTRTALLKALSPSD